MNATLETAPATDMIHVVAAALVDAEGRVLLAQRPPGKHLAGYWEFPGGKVEPDESPLAALRREIREEIGVDVGDAQRLIAIPWRYPGKTILLDVYRVDEFHGVPHSCEGQPLKWVPLTSLDPDEMPAADHPVIHALHLPPTYLVTPEPGTDEAAFLDRLDAALDRGVRLVQLRAKALDDARLQPLAREALRRVRAAGGQLLINGRFDLVEELGLDGVHLTSAQLRRLDERPLSRLRWVAASCHDAEELALAQKLDVDFVVFGPVAATASHPGATPVGWDAFERFCAASTMPVYALGGMREHDIDRARVLGGQGVAAISGLW
ncbi:MAG TPA: Nudix family hydrolase [Tahibacter sp.]|nr:Nudix family hydrolase [Tahibacter sp.]